MGYALSFLWFACFAVTLVMATCVAILMAPQPAKPWTVLTIGSAALWALADFFSNIATTHVQLEHLSHAFVFAWAFLPFTMLRAAALYASPDGWARFRPLTALLAVPPVACIVLSFTNLLHSSWTPASHNGMHFEVAASGWQAAVAGYFVLYAALAAVLLVRAYRRTSVSAFRSSARVFTLVVMPAAVLGGLINGPLHWLGFPVPFAGSMIVCVVAVALAAEILRQGFLVPLARARRWAEDSVRASDERYRTLMATSPDAIVVTDMAGVVVAVSQSTKRMFGFESVAEFPTSNTRFSELVAERDQERLPYVETPADLPRVVHGMRLTGRRRDGSEFPMEVSAGVLHAADGSPEGLLLVARDTSERELAVQEQRKLQEQVLQAQKIESLGMLAGAVAHDFNNILAAVLGNAGLALQRMPHDAPSRPFVQTIEQAAKSASLLTRQLLTYTGRGRKQVKAFDLSGLADETVKLLQVSIPKNVKVDVALGTDLPLVLADPGQLQQVVMNLISNAAQAVGDGPGHIAVGTSSCEVAPNSRFDHAGVPIRPGDYAVVEVSDSGPGIPPEVRRNIFDPFFTTKTSGRGLGLAAVLGIVRNHEGAVELDTHPERGTTFRILLPLPPSSLQQGAPGVHEGTAWPRFHAQTVLVAEDEPAVLEVLRATLQTAGLTVIAAHDGEQAVKAFVEHRARISAVVLDVNMPNKDGVRACAEMRERVPDLPVLWVTAQCSEETASILSGMPHSSYLPKPFTAWELLSSLATLMGAGVTARRPARATFLA